MLCHVFWSQVEYKIVCFISREDFEYSEMDADLAYMAISEDSIEALIKLDLHEEFENDKHNWFVTPKAARETYARTFQG